MAAAPNLDQLFPGQSECFPERFSDTITDRDDTASTRTTVATGATRGTIIHGLIFHPAQDVITPQVIFIWIMKLSGDWRLLAEVAVSAFTADDTTPAPEYTWEPPFRPFVLAEGALLGASNTVGETWICTPVAHNYNIPE